MRKQGLYTIDEWDIEVYLGNVSEPTPAGDVPQTGIGCGNTVGSSDRVCGAHLIDLPLLVINEMGEIRRAVGCQVCGDTKSRAIARKLESE